MPEMPEKESQENWTCPNCHLGRLSPKVRTFVHQYEETMLCVPATPGWECDVCHVIQFDPIAIQRIETLIGQAGPPPNHYQPLMRPARRTEKRTESTTQVPFQIQIVPISASRMR